ncbi:SGNH/GDSL hydrolase family protein [Alkalibacterium sp. s-m-22]|jgi:lysophospholipase L1-like esterase|uniref:Lysophospholipase L1 n=1 Tax=Alkalibacterium pelagium TaxID=426702 RepID=A0A1H7F737_9LACT|nr:SGNH/GDSL hydrolase family protein [Alkalibacterium pelagium]GEN49509.1 lipase [Alkalibacterium pelagium]SEK20142.1 Lysophospholipase L1 [Alkalibacterium pelagium]
MKINKNDTLLFIGDSITDVGRDRMDGKDLGKGFPLMVASHLQSRYPAKRLTVLNRGIGGDSLKDLKRRWEDDCLIINPDIVTLLIGVNDTWRNQNDGVELTDEELDEFESDYRFLLKSLHQRTDARVILMEPFVLPYPKDRVGWRNDLDKRIQIVRKMARDYQTELIPLDGLLNAAGIRDGFSYYTGDDGVHPTVAGHGLIASSWLKAVNE